MTYFNIFEVFLRWFLRYFMGGFEVVYSSALLLNLIKKKVTSRVSKPGGGREGGEEPIRGLKKNRMERGQVNTHTDYSTTRSNRPSGPIR